MVNQYTGGVITSDLVQSSKLSIADKEETLQELQDIVIELLELLDKVKHHTHISVFRGDSFQIAKEGGFGLLQMSILIRAFLIQNKKDVRMSLAIGTMERKPTRQKQSDGEAFVLSGHGLDVISNTSRRTQLLLGKEMFAIHREHNGLSQELENYAMVLDDIISGWTRRQAETIYHMIKAIRLSSRYKSGGIYESQDKVAQAMEVTQQSISKLLKAAKWDVIRPIIERYNYIADLASNGVYLSSGIK